MKNIFFLLLIVCLGYYLYQGPMASMFQGAEFPMATLRDYEDKLIAYHSGKAVPRDTTEETPLARKGKVVVMDSSMSKEPRLSEIFWQLPDELRAATPEQVETVIVLHFCSTEVISLGKSKSLWCMAFEWPSGRCLGYEMLASWPDNYQQDQILEEYPDLQKTILGMTKL